MTRILFVDDEPRILEGLRQSLRGKRKEWEMVFADGSASALLELGRGAFDIIVSDVRMPGVDGAELLTRAATLQPQAARLVLTGDMNESAATRAAAVAHRFLSKPCDPETLIATLARTLELRALLASDTIRRCLGGASALPSLPKVCQALNQALADESADVESVARIIEKDAGMASKVLQLVNSSFFGLPRRVANIAQAVSYLGLNTMRNLVLARCMFTAFVGDDLATFEREQSRALLASRVARRLLKDRKQAEAAGTAALLHDVGILAIAARLPDEHREIRKLAVSRKVPLSEIERERLGTTHAEIGAYLLGLWGLPHDVIEAVASHHRGWAEATVLDVGVAVQVADAVSAELLLLSPGEARLYGEPPPAELLDRLRVTEILKRLRDEIRAA